MGLHSDYDRAPIRGAPECTLMSAYKLLAYRWNTLQRKLGIRKEQVFEYFLIGI